jgi:polysaccharide export outer membrane protein
LTEPNEHSAQCQTVESVELRGDQSMSAPESLSEKVLSLCKLCGPLCLCGENRLGKHFTTETQSSHRDPQRLIYDKLLRALAERFNPSLRIDVTSLLSAIVLIIPFATATQVSAQSAQPASQSTSQTGDRYRIGPGDVLDIRIFNRPQLSRDAVRVEGSGMIRMPLVDGEIQAACKTEGELAQDIKTRYLKFYRNPQVDVFIKEYHAREVAVIGAINEQGRYQMQRRLRLLELLTYAKGPSDKAGQTINIVRAPKSSLCDNGANSGEEGGSFLSLRLNDTMRGEEKANPYVEPGDIVTLPEADQVYVVGNVYSPKTLPMKEPLSVSRAVAMAGGPLRDSKTDRVHIVRQQQGSASGSEIYVNLNAIARKQAQDVMLQPNDIVEVPESTGKSMIRSLLGVVAPAMGQLPVRVIP